MKYLLFTSLIGSSCAFAPALTQQRITSRRSSTEPSNDVDTGLSPEESEQVTPSVAPINGWIPDDSLPCYGLPGAVAPTGYFDPIGFSRSGITLDEVKRYREAEVQHGRVAMIAAVGYLAGETIPGPFSITGPANDQLQQMPPAAFAFLTLAIGTAEITRAKIGWVEPDLGSWTRTLFKLRDSYYPGDLGFDPLGLKPSNAKDFANMQTKELQNGRLAMLGVAGMCSQELVNHKTILETFDFYQKVYSGINPYDVSL
mmetsp:Transcript_23707/g.54057  ORF Transcript_23707/g.54057 Transcript_23707/m.54057 type:complete len:257 (-) Transcript_23707:168-938(-)|eukprot:CAMPEP_0113312250 /NCGR_PEP_ID=MMETSP0010_2-20120614/9151_1 /TAXON_ID=216773 ORGANISM="Corethron hystrix, Strain 308" /NCGR_SAMPLE_ID=MMETSP0010_2 /ASSEMBLY_ACC=CAM_ASM_000155 /LENGTH=256 /DNA_ID=CAMNT_0000168029 /DNA_START=66 /DNA_END=836 /DNA_ORIENTATION=- /assembly_acc=CAM_ASM_000155